MNGDPVKKAMPVLIAVCVAIALVAAVYFVAQYRAESENNVPVASWVPNAAVQEPIEAGGIEGIFNSQGFLVTGLDGKSKNLGLAIGDNIRKIGKQPVQSFMQIRALAPGVALRVDRNGEPTDLTLGAATAMQPVDARAVDVRGLTGQLTPEGLWITSTEGTASAWGLRAGDLVRNVDGQPLTVRRDATTLLRNLNERNGFVFELVRDGARLYLPYNTGNTGTPAPGQLAMAPTPMQNQPNNQWALPQNQPNNQWALPPAPQAQAGLGAPYGATGVACPACGAWHGPGWRRGSCWRCGNVLHTTSQPVAGAGLNPVGPCGQTPQRYMAGAGLNPAATQPVGPCGQTPQRYTGGW